MSATWDQSRFDDALKRYLEVSKKDMVTVLNTKAYHVARKATWYTNRAKPEDIRAFMSKYVKVTVERRKSEKTGRMKKFTNKELVQSGSKNAPAIALLINRNRGLRGKKGLYGGAFVHAMDYEQSRRMRAIGYIVAGWLHAIRKLQPGAEEKARSREARGIVLKSVPRGSATLATESNPVATIENHSSSGWDKRDGFARIAGAGLWRAFNEEADDMARYIHKKLSAAAKRFNESR